MAKPLIGPSWLSRVNRGSVGDEELPWSPNVSIFSFKPDSTPNILRWLARHAFYCTAPTSRTDIMSGRYIWWKSIRKQDQNSLRCLAGDLISQQFRWLASWGFDWVLSLALRPGQASFHSYFLSSICYIFFSSTAWLPAISPSFFLSTPFIPPLQFSPSPWSLPELSLPSGSGH